MGKGEPQIPSFPFFFFAYFRGCVIYAASSIPARCVLHGCWGCRCQIVKGHHGHRSVGEIRMIGSGCDSAAGWWPGALSTGESVISRRHLAGTWSPTASMSW